MDEHRRWATIRPAGIGQHDAYRDEAQVSELRELVFRLRAEAGLTQAELAERMGTTQSAIARLEGGGARPSLRTLGKLAAALGQELSITIGPARNPDGSTVVIG